MSVLLRADSIGRSYGARRVLTSAYFEAAAGAVTALVGRNGAGKTTLLKIAAGWMAADHGMVEFRGRRYHNPNPAALAADGLFYLPVDRSILSPPFRLAQHLDAVEARFGRGNRGEVLERLGITRLEHVRCAAFSGGERRRAGLALALLRRPACLLLDEPFRGIDPRDVEMLQAEMRTLAASGCAVVLTGHEIPQILSVAHSVIWVRDGSTQMMGDPAAAEADWRFRREYLGVR
ncbi:MAG TPA: ATP-binding cassette domain-containing protein [Longimicrobium sp.]|nr:ATP-binding cassette domain-containing protein [Longimicrobium sp.]